MTKRKRVRLGRIYADHLSFDEAIDAIVALCRKGEGGYVVTPNVDHVVLAETDPALRGCYADASLSLVDGKPLLWMAQAIGHPLPEKISGSDLVLPLMRAAEYGLRVFLLGAKPGVGDRAAQALREQYPKLDIAGVLSPPLGFEKDPQELERVLSVVEAAKPNLVLVALGCPKQELFMAAHRARLSPAVMLGIGATLDFLAGEVRRAPRWMSEAGLEWTYRILQEPRRMAARYLVRDRAIGPIFLRMLQLPPHARAFEVEVD